VPIYSCQVPARIRVQPSLVDRGDMRYAVLVVAPGADEAELVNPKAKRSLDVLDVDDRGSEPVCPRSPIFDFRSNVRSERSQRLLGGGWIDNRANLGDAVGGEAPLPGVLADGFFVRGDVDAVDLVVGDVAV